MVVDSNYRGKGVGRKIIIEAINIAKDNGAENITLTSRAERVEARALYGSLGFVTQETDVFRLVFVERSG